MRSTQLLSRRSVLKLGTAGLVAAPMALRPAQIWAGFAAATDPLITPVRRPFGRAMQGVAVREKPASGARIVRTLKWNEVVEIAGQTESDDSPSRYNKIWYKTRDGYVHSAYVQPAENATQTPERSVPAEGFWAEVYVPAVIARTAPRADAPSPYRVYFGCVFQVLEVVEGDTTASGTQAAGPWYRISDGRTEKLYVPAESLRRVQPAELTPVSPEIPLERKRIEVDLRKQITTAYEDDTQVFSARVATGAQFRLADGSVTDFSTTPGSHRIFLKTPSRRMSGGTNGDSDYYDLPGIPWVSYFTNSRIAFHGAYWHNDYGSPRSHGCVNMLPEDALWVYRWTLPAAPYAERFVKTVVRDEGSLVKVF